MRCVILTDDFPPQQGGVATWTAAVARALSLAGDQVTVFCRARPGQSGLGYEVRGVRGPSFGRWGGWWTALVAREAVRTADHVLVTSWPVARRLRGWMPAGRVNVVFHGSDVTGPTAGRVSVPGRRWAVSQFLAEALVCDGVPVGVLPAPVDVSGQPSCGDGPWVFVARATPLKGGDRFIRIAAAAGKRAVVIGDGPALAGWRQLAASLNAPVRFVGAIDHASVLTHLSGASAAFLLPRAGPEGRGTEGFGLSLVEAASVGVPVVGCRTGGVPEAVGPGLLLEDPDEPIAAASAVLAWLNPSRGAEARTWVARTHGTTKVVQALRDSLGQ